MNPEEQTPVPTMTVEGLIRTSGLLVEITKYVHDVESTREALVGVRLDCTDAMKGDRFELVILPDIAEGDALTRHQLNQLPGVITECLKFLDYPAVVAPTPPKLPTGTRSKRNAERAAAAAQKKS